MRIVIGDSTESATANGRIRQDNVVCRFTRKEGMQLTLVKEGGAMTVRIQGEQPVFDPPAKNGSRTGPAEKPRRSKTKNHTK